MAKDKEEKKAPGLRQRGNAWQWIIRYGGVQYSGTARTKTEAKKARSEKLYELEHGIVFVANDYTVTEWFEEWLQTYKMPSVKHDTIDSYKRVYRSYIAPYCDGGRKPMKLTEVRGEHLQTVLNATAAKHSQSTVNLVAAVLSSMFKQAYKNDLIKQNPYPKVTVPKKVVKKKFTKAFSPEEQKIFLQYAEESPYYNAFLTALLTGMRPGEIRGLTWDDIDFTGETIHVCSTITPTKGGYVRDTPKTLSSDRFIPIHPELKKVLWNQRTLQAEKKLQFSDLWQEDEGFENLVFTNCFRKDALMGKVIVDNGLGHEMQLIIRRIKKDYPDFPDATPHWLRHTFATRGIENGIPVKVMQELLGHTSITMTSDIYCHVMPSQKATEILKISAL